MKARLNPYQAAPELMQAMMTLEHAVVNAGLEHSLIELVKIRASQINGCAFCIHMHTSDARKAGETDERMHLLSAWRESPLFSQRERAALEWTESLTLVSQTHAPAASYELLASQFDSAEQVKLTMLIGAINVWNRVAIGFALVHPVQEKHANVA